MRLRKRCTKGMRDWILKVEVETLLEEQRKNLINDGKEKMS